MARYDDDDDDRPRSRGRDDHDDADGDDDRPRKRRRRDDDEDDYEWERRKRKGGGGSGGGKVVLIVLAVVGGLILVCGIGGFIFLLPAISKVREAAARTNEMNNLKQLSIGALNHASSTRNLPPADQSLSWRVHILPYIEQDAVYRQFDLKSGWDQGRNKSLADTSIRTYLSPLDDPPGTQTHYRVFTGDGSAFDSALMKQRGGFPNYIMDGTSNTLMIIDTAETVPWPAPKEVLLQQGGQFPEFGHPKRSQILTALCDGSVRSLDKKTADAAKIRAMATAAGGEVIADW
ncbi:MAG: DUF1559 domain-containing protein [Gemmataceae bacterium]